MSRSDKAPIHIHKTPQGLMPLNEWSQGQLAEFDKGQVFNVKPRKGGRNVKRNALYWAGLQTLVRATENWTTVDQAHNDIKRHLGYYETYINPFTRKEEYRVKSISFAKMNEMEFKTFFEAAQKLVAESLEVNPWEVAA